MKRIALLCFTFFVLIAPSFSQTSVEKLIAHFPFDGNVRDVSGNNHQATVRGATLTTDRFNTPNRAYYFDGLDDNIVLGSSFDLIPKTISFWFNAHTIDANSRVIYASDNPDLNYGITAVEIKTIVGLPKLATHITSSRDTATVVLNTWHFFTITVNDDSTHFYLDGVKLKSRERTGYPRSDTGVPQTIVGSHRQGNTGSLFFHGKIDDVKIYNRELTKEEVKVSYLGLSIDLGEDFCIRPNQIGLVPATGFESYLWSNGSTEPTLRATQPGNYSLIATDRLGNKYYGEIKISACPQPDFTYTFDCKSNTFTFSPILNFPYDRFHWKYDKQIVPNILSPAHKFSTEGVNQVSLNVYHKGEEYTIDKFITYTQSVTPYLGKDTTLCMGNTLTLQPEILKGTALKWSDGSTGTSLVVSLPGTYWVEATRGDCVIRDEIVVSNTTCQEEFISQVMIPNIFTPNGDGQNDFFQIQNLNAAVKNKLTVYNRWGQQVFHSPDYKNEWTGSKQEGVFYYVLTLGAKGDVYKGWVEVIR
ncbi:T9SS type B sorting domain-containing protein [Rufibacter hautae]|uniref:T9SS type B sorting domain-containing protein n=1 Tax=Rufibacter hautae TaxID=2595005 RepID=A0A5B6THB5_9BACT|nr:gliding motility-associated C-terminal domain-containing protein [Rufibacter hautae]KAA3438580.1 T9SS type B sorting domain-containing protein [Rufibacter hautae]